MDTQISATPPAPGDFCQLTQVVVFPIGVVIRQVSVQLLDDQAAEGEESFYVELVVGKELTNAILHGNLRSMVTITDTEDCKFAV